MAAARRAVTASLGFATELFVMGHRQQRPQPLVVSEGTCQPAAQGISRRDVLVGVHKWPGCQGWNQNQAVLLGRPGTRRLGVEGVARRASADCWQAAQRVAATLPGRPLDILAGAADLRRAADFVGMPDPVPFRSGMWRGDRAAITPPPIEEPRV